MQACSERKNRPKNGSRPQPQTIKAEANQHQAHRKIGDALKVHNTTIIEDVKRAVAGNPAPELSAHTVIEDVAGGRNLPPELPAHTIIEDVKLEAHSMGGRIIEIVKGKHYRVIVEAGKNLATGNRKRIVREVHGRKSVAEALYAKLTTQVDEQTFAKPSKAAMKEWLTTWLKDYKSMVLRTSTYENYTYMAKHYIIPHLGGAELRGLHTDHLQQFYRKMLDKGLSSASVRRMHQIIHGALQQAVKNKMITSNAAKETTLPALTKSKVKAMTTEEQRAFLAVLGKDRLGPAFLVLLGTGIRRGELLGLTWRDVDLDTGTMYIRQALSYTITAKIEHGPPKNESSFRTLPLPPVVVTALRLHLDKMQYEENYRHDGPVFSSKNGKFIIPRNFNRKFTQLIKKAGLQDINLHMLRHTFATRLLEAKESLKVIQELLGHADIGSTDIYSHISPELKRHAADKMNDILQMGTKMAGTGSDEGNEKPGSIDK